MQNIEHHTQPYHNCFTAVSATAVPLAPHLHSTDEILIQQNQGKVCC